METNVKKLLSDAARRAADMAESAKDVLADAGRVAMEKTDVAKLNLELVRLRAEGESIFAEIGRTFYQMNGGSWPTDNAETAEQHIETLLGRASEKEMLIRELEGRIAELSNKMDCPVCKHSCDKASAFCPACGAALHPVQTAEKAE